MSNTNTPETEASQGGEAPKPMSPIEKARAAKAEKQRAAIEAFSARPPGVAPEGCETEDMKVLVDALPDTKPASVSAAGSPRLYAALEIYKTMMMAHPQLATRYNSGWVRGSFIAADLLLKFERENPEGSLPTLGN